MVVWLAHESDELVCKPSNLKKVTLSVGVERCGNNNTETMFTVLSS